MKKCSLCHKQAELFKAFWVKKDEPIGSYSSYRRDISKTVYGKVCADCIRNHKYTDDFKGPYTTEHRMINGEQIPVDSLIEANLLGNL